MNKHKGNQSIEFQYPIAIKSAASVVSTKEGEGPLSENFDVIINDMMAGQDSWEMAESEFVRQGLELAVKKSGLTMEDMDYIIAGDLLNQNTSTTFGIRDFNRPVLGVFSACSTIGEAMGLGGILIDGGFATNVLIGASSHFCAAEKQFRFPLELGTQRPPTSTWTVTGEGSFVLSNQGKGPCITGITTGKIVDLGVTDAYNMGAAMAPSAVDTLINHFMDFESKPSDYDLILTGDLGYVGHELVIQMMKERNYNLSRNYMDCGMVIFDRDKQDTHCGGSGCACAATTFASYYYPKMQKKELNKILLIPTGALLSPTSTMQGESIPGIAHGVLIENK